MRRKAAVAGTLVLGALATAADARELWRSGDASLELSGSVKELLTFTQGTDAGDFAERSASDPRCARADTFENCAGFGTVGEKDAWQSLTRMRTRFDLRIDANLSAVLAYDHELRFGTLDTLGADLSEGFGTDSIFDLEWDVRAFGMPSDHRRWRHLVYRAYVKAETRGFEAVVGRQRIPWGVGRLWNPVDRFNAIPPLAIEADQTRGVDAVDLRWNFGGFHFLEVVYQPNGSRADAAYGVRFHGSRGELDYSLLGGRWDEAWAAGFDLAGNLGPAAFRVETIWTDPRRAVWPVGDPGPSVPDPFWQVVVSLDHNFAVGTGLYALVEHFYNGNALGFGAGEAGTLLPFFEADGAAVRPADGDLFAGSRVISNARHQTGVQLGYDLLPILRIDLLALYDWNGHSAVVAPVVAFSPVDSVELTLGVQVFLGKEASQYGSQETLAYLIAEWFF